MDWWGSQRYGVFLFSSAAALPHQNITRPEDPFACLDEFSFRYTKQPNASAMKRWHWVSFSRHRQLFPDHKKKTPFRRLFFGGTTQNRTGDQGVAVPRLTAWLWYQISGAADEARTRYLHLGKVALYQMSYSRILWCLRAESLFCGKATAVKICHRHIFKSRLSIPHVSERILISAIWR